MQVLRFAVLRILGLEVGNRQPQRDAAQLDVRVVGTNAGETDFGALAPGSLDTLGFAGRAVQVRELALRGAGKFLDRKRSELDSIKSGANKAYRYRIEVASDAPSFKRLLRLNA